MNAATLPRDWDVVVVGAGVAGSVSAYRLARLGLSVLLVEKSAWPRDKACGGCLNAASLQALSDAGLAEAIHAGPAYTMMHLASGRQQARVPLPEGRALSRRYLDARLVECATSEGASFLPATQALLGATQPDGRTLTLRHGDETLTVTARLVLGCDGLGSRLLREDEPDTLEVDNDSHIGLGTTLIDAPEPYATGIIHMACGPYGYVGLVRVEDAQLNIGAALDPRWVKQHGGPASAVAATLRSAGFATPAALQEASWHGTPKLTRRRHRLGAARVLVLGDAAGYVEPFTGEGMGWALASAAAIEPLALEAVNAWHDDLVERWTACHTELIRTRQLGCRGLSSMLRHPRLLETLLPVIDTLPGAVAPLTAWLNRDYKLTPAEDT
ncbi:NAD(P)/FAD-dependent oxidoreductase [Halomonas sp. WWR20]